MKTCSIIIFAILLIACNRQEAKVYEWRGPNRSGVYSEKDLLKSWPENGPRLLWENNDLGYGYGSPTLAGNNLYVIGTRDSTSCLLTLDKKGKRLSETETGNEWVVNYPGSRCIPTVVDNLVYVITGKGEVTCVNTSSGEIKWKCNMVADFGGVIPRFGYSESLVVDGEKVFCCPGGPEHNVVALDRFTGKPIWSCRGKGERSAYHPPTVIECGTRKLLITFSAYHLMAIDAVTGQLLWTHEQVNTPPDKREPGIGDTHSNTTLYFNNTLYYVEGDGNCAVALRLNDDGTKATQIWNNTTVDNYMGGIVLIDNYLYSCAFSRNNLVKIDIQNGAITDSLHIGRGTLIAADKMLYYYNTKGEVHLVSIEGDKMQDVSMFKVTRGSREHFAHPVIDKGVLYIRHGEYLGAYSISKY
jgi:outer membrane protein assembly factor BamB